MDLQITFDAADPARLGSFWSLALGYEADEPPEGFDSWDAWCDAMGIPEESRNDRYAISDPEGRRPRVFFQRVPEPKAGKNRVHLDLGVSGGPAVPLQDRRPKVDDKVAELVAAGATQVARFDEHDEYWVVMVDPEGNEFCVQ